MYRILVLAIKHEVRKIGESASCLASMPLGKRPQSFPICRINHLSWTARNSFHNLGAKVRSGFLDAGVDLDGFFELLYIRRHSRKLPFDCCVSHAHILARG